MNATSDQALEATRALNAYELARLADCHTPDALDSEGAHFLTGVRADVTARFEDGELDADSPADIADAAVPIYTYPLWTAFVDLGGYREDVSEMWSDPSNLGQAACVALYMIAERLAAVLIEDLSEGTES